MSNFLRPIDRSATKRSINRLSLRANLSWTLIGNTTYAICQWLMLIALAKLGSPDIVGEFALGLAVTAPVIMLTNLQLRSIQATDAKQQYTFGHYFGLRLVMTVVALMCVLGIAFASGYHGRIMLVILLVGLAKAFEAISDIIYGLLQQHERMDRIAISMLGKGILALAAFTLLIYTQHSIVAATISLATVWLVVLIFFDLRSAKKILEGGQQTIRPSWSPRTLYRLGQLALPVGIVTMLTSLNANMPRYFLEHYTGTKELGIYAALSYVMVGIGTITNAIGQAAIPRLAQYYSLGRRHAYVKLLCLLLLVGLLLGGGGVVIAVYKGAAVLSVIYGSQYAVEAKLFLLLMLANTFYQLASFLWYGITAARYLAIQMPLTLMFTAGIWIANSFFVPHYGLIGAAYATLIGGIFYLLGHSLVLAAVVMDLRKREYEDRAVDASV